jgi:hypothetical protein
MSVETAAARGGSLPGGSCVRHFRYAGLSEADCERSSFGVKKKIRNAWVEADFAKAELSCVELSPTAIVFRFSTLAP